jgi:GNAT superfamily N-acetyltransferase
MILQFKIELLRKNHKRENFDCGDENLNQFLKKYARQNQEKGFGRTFVAALPNENEVLGYYTLSAGSVSFDIVPDKVPRYPIPTAHLGRLATDLQMRGQGLGELLLIDALERALLVAEKVGIYAVELFASTDLAKNFYLKYGFISLQDDDKHLYLPIETLKRSGLI